MQGLWRQAVNYWLLIIVLICGSALGGWRYWQVHSGLEKFNLLFGKEIVVAAQVVDDPDVRPSYTQLTLKSEQLPGLVLVRVPKYPPWHYGDQVTVSGRLSQPKNFATNLGREFDYQTYLAVRGIGAIVDKPKVVLVKSANSFSLTGLLFKIKHLFVSNVEQAITEPEATLAAGITVGERRSLSAELVGYFQATSLIHIVVLSGYNLAIVALGFMWLAQKLAKKWQIILAAIGSTLFAVMVGGGASVLRALIMALIGLLSQVVGRTYDALRALMVAALIMITWNPLVIFDVGFQLSFLATIGVLLVAPWWSKKLGWVPEKFGLREIVATTLGAQTAVLPILIYTSGIVSIVSLPANVLVTPVVPLAMLLVFIVGMIGFFSSGLALLVGGVARLILTYIIKMTTWFAVLPFSTISLPLFSGWWVVAIYLIWLVWAVRKNYLTNDVAKS